jgi:hypothetical protein
MQRQEYREAPLPGLKNQAVREAHQMLKVKNVRPGLFQKSLKKAFHIRIKKRI